jgi:hypothetical protein
MFSAWKPNQTAIFRFEKTRVFRGAAPSLKKRRRKDLLLQ